MKKKNFIVQVALFAIISFSVSNCSKKPSEDGTTTLPATTFKFAINGTIYHWNGNSADNPLAGSRITKTAINGTTYYVLSALPSTAGMYVLLSLKLNTPTLSTTTYTLAATTASSWTIAEHYCGLPDGLICTSSEVGDMATITIAKKHDGYIDGTFTARLTNIDGSLAKVNVIDGEFYNVKIVE